jgi:hypothetical protein
MARAEEPRRKVPLPVMIVLVVLALAGVVGFLVAQR